jgi:hypothetical protein
VLTATTALTLAALLADARCGVEIARVLDRLGARGEAIVPLAPDPVGDRGALIPTGALGVWVRVTVQADGEPLLERVTAAQVERQRFGERCEAIDDGAKERPPEENAWGDAALAETLAAGGAGVILLWSPHMPLSVDAYGILEALTREMGLRLVAVLHPDADLAYARSIAAERGLPSGALRLLGGIELAFRGMTRHAPSFQVFAEGRLAGPVLPGYKDRATLRLAIERALHGAYGADAAQAERRTLFLEESPVQRFCTSSSHCVRERLMKAQGASPVLKGFIAGAHDDSHRLPIASAASRRAGSVKRFAKETSRFGSTTAKRNRFGPSVSFGTVFAM